MPADSADPLRRTRLVRQRLLGRPAASVAEAVRSVAALQAQELAAAALAVRARTTDLTAEDVRRALEEERSVVRTWAMRGTLHLLPAEDAGWIVALLGPGRLAATRRRREQLGLDDETTARALEAAAGALADGAPLTRHELVATVRRRGVPVEADGQAPVHLAAAVSLAGLAVHGPVRPDGQSTYVLAERWLGERWGGRPDDPPAELARRYLAGHAPAEPADFVAWSGLPAAEARAAFARAGAVPDVPAPDGRRVRLLGRFDEWLLGWRSRELVLDAAHARLVRPGGGVIRATLVVDGRVAGTWRQRRGGDRLLVTLEPFRPLRSDVVAAAHEEVTDLGRFLGMEAELDAEGRSGAARAS